MANRDPGINSDKEDKDVCRDDIFQFNRLSAWSLGLLGTVSPALTPDLGAMRRGDLEIEAMASVMEEPEPRRKVSPGKEDWQQKLCTLQRDANPVQSLDEEEEDKTSQASMTSHATLPDDSSLPSYSQAMSRKKKIIPVMKSNPESSLTALLLQVSKTRITAGAGAWLGKRRRAAWDHLMVGERGEELNKHECTWVQCRNQSGVGPGDQSDSIQ